MAELVQDFSRRHFLSICCLPSNKEDAGIDWDPHKSLEDNPSFGFCWRRLVVNNLQTDDYITANTNASTPYIWAWASWFSGPAITVMREFFRKSTSHTGWTYWNNQFFPFLLSIRENVILGLFISIQCNRRHKDWEILQWSSFLKSYGYLKADTRLTKPIIQLLKQIFSLVVKWYFDFVWVIFSE